MLKYFEESNNKHVDLHKEHKISELPESIWDQTPEHDEIFDNYYNALKKEKEAIAKNLFFEDYSGKTLRTERAPISNSVFHTNKIIDKFLATKGKNTWSSAKGTSEGEKLYQDIINIQKNNPDNNKAVLDFIQKNYPEFDPIDRYSHYIHLGTPGEKILEPIKFNTKVKTGDVIAKLKNRNITTPFDGIIGKRDFSNDIDVSKSSIILNLEDTSVLFVDVDIPETFAPYVKKGQNVNIKFSGNALKKYSGTVESTASRIDTNKRSLQVRIKHNNTDNELLSGSLLEISINYNERNSLSILDTSLLMEGDNVYVYKVDKENTVKKVAVEIGLRKKGIVEIKSGLENGDTVVAEGLKKTRPNGKIKPIPIILFLCLISSHQ